MANNKTIIVITDGFPYDRADSFLHDEFNEINRRYSNVIYLPQHETGKLLHTFNENIHLDRTLIETSKKFHENRWIKNLGIVCRIFLAELFRSKKAGYIVSHPKKILKGINRGLHIADSLKPILSSLPKDVVIYSTWMNSAALALSILKSKGVITKFSFRVSGYDIFDDRHKGNYMPFRVFNFKHASAIVALSSVAQKYLVAKNIYPKKIVINYSGIYPKPLNPFTHKNTFTLISCSNIIELKRVGLIADALMFVDFDVNWIHIGEGDERKLIEEKVKKLPSTIHVNLMGQLNQSQINEIYQNTPINLFIHVSRTEGLGMAIIEAQSYGIPQLCCAAGGVVDVVTNKTGILMPVEITPQQIADAIKTFQHSEMNSNEFREKIQLEFNNKFEITKNFDTVQKILEQGLE